MLSIWLKKLTIAFTSKLSKNNKKTDDLPPIPPQFQVLLQFKNGGGERARTDGLLRARQALSQLSYTPKKCGGPGWS